MLPQHLSLDKAPGNSYINRTSTWVTRDINSLPTHFEHHILAKMSSPPDLVTYVERDMERLLLLLGEYPHGKQA